MTAAEALEKRIFELEEELRAEKLLAEKSQGDVARLQVRDIRVSHVTYVSLVRHVCRSCDGGNRTARGLA